MSEEKNFMETEILREQIKTLELQLAQKEVKKPISGDDSFETVYLDCICGDNHDLLRFVFMDDKEYPEIWSEVHLTQQTFWKRCVYAFKYVFFNQQSRYGAFGNWSMQAKDCERMKSILEKFEQACKRSSLRSGEVGES